MSWDVSSGNPSTDAPSRPPMTRWAAGPSASRRPVWSLAGPTTRRTAPPASWLRGTPSGSSTTCGGREVRRQLGPQAVLSRSWNRADLPEDQEIHGEGPAGVATLERRRYSYTSGGHVSAIDELGTGTRRFQLDAVGRVTSVVGPQRQERYAYDAVGNVSEMEASGPDGRFVDERETSGTLVRRAGGSTYEHDRQGRVVRRIKRTLSGIRKVWNYRWSPENRLTDLFTPDGVHWRYRYDALGRRISKECGDGTSGEHFSFVWDGEVLTEEVLPSGGVRTWEYEPGTHKPVFQADAGPEQDDYDRRFHAIVTDAIGTPAELISEEGEISWRSRTTLWGQDVGTHAGETDCPLRFPGQYHDAESGWHYNFYRYYDPLTAQYTSPDPLGLLPEDNQHGYVRNPLSWLDALGLAPCAKVIALRLWKARNNQGDIRSITDWTRRKQDLCRDHEQDDQARTSAHREELRNRAPAGGARSDRSEEMAGPCD